MKRSCDTDNPLVRDGVSQAQRLVPDLDPKNPNFFRVDERSVADLLRFVQRYAEQLQYYDRSNKPAGNWQSFIDNDVATVIALMSKKDVTALKACFDALLPILESSLIFDVQVKSAIKRLFDLIFTLAGIMNEWYEKAVNGLAVKTAVHRIITAQLRGQLNAVISHYYYARKNGFLSRDDTLIPEDCKDGLLTAETVLDRPFHAVWIITEEEDWTSYLDAIAKEAEGTKDKGIFSDPETASSRLIAIFDVFFNGLRQVIHESPDFLKETVEKWPHHKPHMALFLAFLQLFDKAQKHINTLTDRHLDFFYKKVLRFVERQAMPDRVHVIFELAKQARPHLLKADTLLKAGKDSQDKDVFYKLDRDITVNRASVSQLKTVFIDSKDGHRVYAAAAANSRDGQGEVFDSDEPSWKTFGESQKEAGGYRDSDEQTMQFGLIGFAIASPILLLKEGKRTITITATSSDNLPAGIPINADGVKAFSVTLTGEEEWITVTPSDVQPDGDNKLVFTIDLGLTDGAVVGYDKKVHGGDYDTDRPILIITLAHNLGVEPDHAYKTLRDVDIIRIDLHVTVRGVRNLLVQNDLGLLDAGKPFQPFGASPVVGSRFYIGSDEIFRKKVTDLTVCYEWLDAPASFADHYKVYVNQNVYTAPLSDAAFTADMQVLKEGGWESLRLSFPLFTSEEAEEADCEHQSIEILMTPPDLITPEAPSLSPIIKYDNSSRQGFVRWELNGPTNAFGHQAYAKVYAKQVIAMTQPKTESKPVLQATLPEIQAGKDGMPTKGSTSTDELPNEPYTPVIKSISLDYSASAQIDLSAAAGVSKQTHHFFHIHPFGYGQVKGKTGEKTYLVPRFEFTNGGEVQENEGELYIGLKDLEPRQNLSLLFQVAEGSADPELPKQEVGWSYMSQNRWQSFAPKEVLFDSTNGLLTSGIITFDVSQSAGKDNTVLPSGIYWLRASVTKNSAAVCDLIDVKAQGAQASFVDQKNAPDFLAHSLPAKKISKLKVKQAAIKSISQPYASFGGKVREQQRQLYTRVSERLRHKGRGITIWDYEKLVLEKFPEIYKVKCINHSTYHYRDDASGLEIERSEFAPGFVSLIAIPDLKNKNAVDPLEPRASLNTLSEIRKYLCKLISPFAARHLKVINPLYEKVQVDFGVEFHTGYDRGYYESELNKDIIQFLSPWAFEAGKDIIFGGKLHKSVILNFVEERPYVDYVTDFKMKHYTSGSQPESYVDEAQPVTVRSILVSHGEHIINEVVPNHNE